MHFISTKPFDKEIVNVRSNQNSQINPVIMNLSDCICQKKIQFVY